MSVRTTIAQLLLKTLSQYKSFSTCFRINQCYVVHMYAKLASCQPPSHQIDLRYDNTVFIIQQHKVVKPHVRRYRRYSPTTSHNTNFVIVVIQLLTTKNCHQKVRIINKYISNGAPSTHVDSSTHLPGADSLMPRSHRKRRGGAPPYKVNV